MSERLLLLACPLLVAMSLIACSDAEPPAEETAPLITEAKPDKPVYNAIAAAEPEVVDDGVRVLLDAPLISGLVLPFDYSLIEQKDTTGPIRILRSEMEVFGIDEIEAVAQLQSNLQAEGFKLIDSKGTRGKLHRSYSRGGFTVDEGADMVAVIALSYPGDKKPKNPAAKSRLTITVTTNEG